VRKTYWSYLAIKVLETFLVLSQWRKIKGPSFTSDPWRQGTRYEVSQIWGVGDGVTEGNWIEMSGWTGSPYTNQWETKESSKGGWEED